MRVRYDYSSRRTGKLDNINKHRVSFPSVVREVIRISDVVLELLDARFVDETRHQAMEQLVLISGKKLIFVINKADLVDSVVLRQKIESLGLHPFVLFSCKTNQGRAALRQRIQIEVKRAGEGHAKGHVGIIGYPNTGKSSLINLLVGRGSASRSPEAGHTRGIQKIRFNKDILILDTPGVFSERENSNVETKSLEKHAKVGVRTYDKVKNPDFIIAGLMRENPGVFEKYYKIDAHGDAEILLEELGKKYALLLKGGATDLDRVARRVLKEWQFGKIKVNEGKK